MSDRPVTEPRTEAEKALDRLDEIAPTLWQQQPKGHPMMPMQIILREWVATIRSALAEAAQGAAPRAEGLDVERLRELLNSLGIVGPNIRHAEATENDHLPEPWIGPGWCVCGRAMPCEAAAVGELLR